MRPGAGSGVRLSQESEFLIVNPLRHGLIRFAVASAGGSHSPAPHMATRSFDALFESCRIREFVQKSRDTS